MMNSKDDFMKKVIIGMFAFLFVFTIVMIVVHCITGGTPDVLIGAVFAACIGEYSICGLIKRTKEIQMTQRMKDALEEFDLYGDEEDENVEEVVNAINAHDGDIEEEAID